VEVRIPERGKKSKVLQLAEKNATEKVKQLEAKWESATRNIEEALMQLKEALNLADTPRRIEGYDISHLGGTETVGSMVVTLHGKPANKHYRSFTIQTLKEGDVDDYKALEEVLRRRLKYLTVNLKLEEGQWKEKGVILAKARKGEQKTIEEIVEKQKELSDLYIDYKDFFVARTEKQIVAFARLVTESNTQEIKSLWVDEKYRGEKLGQLLIRKMLSKIKKGKVYVIIDPNPKLEEYYAEIGFRHVLSPPEHLLKKTRAFCKSQLGAKEGNIMVYIISEHKDDSSLAEKPDLLVIDGGKGQVSTVASVLKKMKLEIPLIGLAKREEEIFVPSEKAPIALTKDSQAQFLLQRLRNEAHRFANEHRKKRFEKHAIGSALDDVPGIGTKTKQELLTEFGSVKNIKDASDEQLKNLVSEVQLRALRMHL
jgi:N-acetylglutamate synthase-like GNAT family acetyltransferase